MIKLIGLISQKPFTEGEIIEDKNPGFRFSKHKKTFRDSVSRMRKSYDTTKDTDKKKKIKDWLKFATEHKKKMNKSGWED